MVGPKQVVVEPRFKDQFVIANPTRTYETLLELVPETFVGVATDLMAALDILCKEMRTAFQETGRPLPPWRRKKSLASKWHQKVEPTRPQIFLVSHCGVSDKYTADGLSLR